MFTSLVWTGCFEEGHTWSCMVGFVIYLFPPAVPKISKRKFTLFQLQDL